jgi:DnaJ-class molecular chaperone
LARDPYQELGVSRTATADEIRKAFRKLAKQHHPDANPGDKKAEDKFKLVSAAFDIVGDAEKRKKFDLGQIDADGRETSRGFGGQPGPGPFNAGPFGGGQPGGGGFSAKGSDIKARLDIDLEDAIKGGKKRVAFSDGRTIDVTIPTGAQEGQTLRLKGQGSPGRGGQGDALIELSIKPHPIYRREGEALVMDLPISIPDAVLGGKIEAPTPDGNVMLNVPKGSNSGQTLRLKGRGMPDAKGKRGDLLAKLVVTLPETVEEDLEKFAQAWRDQKPYTPKRK